MCQCESVASARLRDSCHALPSADDCPRLSPRGGPGDMLIARGHTRVMTDPNPGVTQLDVTELLASLAAAEKRAAEQAAHRSADYRAGAADAYADAQATIRKLAGWTGEHDTDRTAD